MGKIATELEAKNISSSSVSISNNQCCTKSRAIAIGCKVLNSYSDNQLVQYEHLQIASSISVSPEYIEDFDSKWVSGNSVVSSTSSWTATIEIDNLPVKGRITCSPLIGNAGNTTVSIDGDGALVPGGPTADVEEWWVSGRVIFKNKEGLLAHVWVSANWIQEIT